MKEVSDNVGPQRTASSGKSDEAAGPTTVKIETTLPQTCGQRHLNTVLGASAPRCHGIPSSCRILMLRPDPPGNIVRYLQQRRYAVLGHVNIDMHIDVNVSKHRITSLR